MIFILFDDNMQISNKFIFLYLSETDIPHLAMLNLLVSSAAPECPSFCF